MLLKGAVIAGATIGKLSDTAAVPIARAKVWSNPNRTLSPRQPWGIAMGHLL